MSGLGAAGFVEGLQGGIAARDTMDRNKQFKQLRKLGIAEKTNELAGARGLAMDDQMAQAKLDGVEFDQEAFDDEWGAFQQDKDPALLRFGKWVGGKMSGMFGGKGEEGGATEELAIAQPKIEPTAKERVGFGPMADGGRVGYAEGGRVYTDEERMKRSYGDLYLTEEEAANASPDYVQSYTRGGAIPVPKRAGKQPIPISGGGVGEFYEDLVRSAGSEDGPLDNTFNAMHGARDIREEDRARYGAAETAYDKGDAARQAIGGMYDGAKIIAGGIATDLGIGTAVEGVKGFIGQDGGQGIPTDTPTTPEGSAIEASTDEPEHSSEAVAQVAISDAQEEFIKNPNYTLLVDQGVRPEDLPSMTTSDWSDYRRKMTMHAMQSGMGLNEAHQMVDDRVTGMQMQGFNRQALIASKYLATGQAREASMALRQAYQYFPNGVGVKFGTQIDPKTGQPVIITMGVDEQTGEPTGSPMIIDQNRLNVMVEQLTDPKAFRTWTKDGHDLQMEINKLQSIDDYRQGSLDISAYNAETDRIGELTAGSGGASASERRQRDQVYAKAMSESGIMEEGFEDPNVVRSLASAMSIYERLSPGIDTNSVMYEVVEAYTADPENGVQRLLEAARGQ